MGMAQDGEVTGVVMKEQETKSSDYFIYLGMIVLQCRCHWS